MSEVENEEDSKSSWQEVIVLFLGDLRAGNTASQVLTDIAEDTDLPEVFHQLCTRYLTAKEWTARTNSGLTIKTLCIKHASMLTNLIMRSRSDGDLLTLSELDVSAVSDCKDAELLSGNSTFDKIFEGRELYSKLWLKKQRKALRKRLGLEAFTEDAAIAVDYISFEALIQDNDLTGRDTPLVDTTNTNILDNGVVCGDGLLDTMKFSTDHLPDVANPSADVQNHDSKEQDYSTETWFARLGDIASIFTYLHHHPPFYFKKIGITSRAICNTL